MRPLNHSVKSGKSVDGFSCDSRSPRPTTGKSGGLDEKPLKPALVLKWIITETGRRVLYIVECCGLLVE